MESVGKILKTVREEKQIDMLEDYQKYIEDNFKEILW